MRYTRDLLITWLGRHPGVQWNAVLRTLYFVLQEVEAALEAEESKVTRAQLELTQYKQEAEKRMADKDEELDNLRYLPWI